MTQHSARHFYHKSMLSIAAGQTLAQLLLWCFLGPIHTFLTQSYLLTNPEARSYIRRAISNFILYIDPSKKNPYFGIQTTSHLESHPLSYLLVSRVKDIRHDYQINFNHAAVFSHRVLISGIHLTFYRLISMVIDLLSFCFGGVFKFFNNIKYVYFNKWPNK